jgi:hypothetical protein
LQLERSPPAQTLLVATLVKTQDFQSSLLEIPGPLGVVFCFSEFQMLSSVEFDDQFCWRVSARVFAKPWLGNSFTFASRYSRASRLNSATGSS